MLRDLAMFIIKEPPKPPKQVFHLATPAHMLAKLGWEIRQFKSLLISAPSELWGAVHLSYGAFNTAVTAWHCGDWAWRSAGAGKSELADRFGFRLNKNDRRNLDALYKAITAECRELHICRDIANGSKHMGADGADPDVSVQVIWQPTDAADAMNWECYLVILDRGETIRAEEVFERAFTYWERLFGELGYIEGQFIDVRPR